ncbi:hypothetical protein BDZ89DRAFT_646755 [Hymenopellis radicata]|nr:hypothetical protein BDZ89DRAFT_646755 [Hymenopellis radicata]
MMSETTSFNSAHTEDKPVSPTPSSSRVRVGSPLYSDSFRAAPGRVLYIRTLCAGCFAIALIIFGVFSIYWGALWQVPAHPLSGLVIDADGGAIGGTVSSALLNFTAKGGKIRWDIWDSDGSDASELVRQERTWVVVRGELFASGALASTGIDECFAVNANASWTLEHASAGYDPATAVTVYASEARNENAFRTFIRPMTEQALLSVGDAFAEAHLGELSSAKTMELAISAPQALLRPISYSIVNLAPFDIPVAAAVDFVGLIFLLILSFFIVMIGASARESSGLEKRLTTSSLIKMRLSSVFSSYFVISLFYSLLSLAFQVDFTRTFGRSGFLIFWMLSYTGMLSVGLLLEAMVTLLTPRFLPFFLITWVIVNVAVASLPLDILPHFFKYGYAMPFYNISAAVRTLLFGTKNQLGQHFGILLGWTGFSIVLLILLQWQQRRSIIRRSAYEFD